MFKKTIENVIGTHVVIPPFDGVKVKHRGHFKVKYMLKKLQPSFHHGENTRMIFQLVLVLGHIFHVKCLYIYMLPPMTHAQLFASLAQLAALTGRSLRSTSMKIRFWELLEYRVGN